VIPQIDFFTLKAFLEDIFGLMSFYVDMTSRLGLHLTNWNLIVVPKKLGGGD